MGSAARPSIASHRVCQPRGCAASDYVAHHVSEQSEVQPESRPAAGLLAPAACIPPRAWLPTNNLVSPSSHVTIVVSSFIIKNTLNFPLASTDAGKKQAEDDWRLKDGCLSFKRGAATRCASAESGARGRVRTGEQRR